MWRYGPIVATFLFVLSLLFNAVTLSGLTRTPQIGEGMREVIYAESVGTYTYVRIGDLLNSAGLGGARAQAFAERALAPGLERIQQQRRLTIPVLYGPATTQAHGWLTLSIYACPLLLVIALALNWFKPKRFKTFSGKK